MRESNWHLISIRVARLVEEEANVVLFDIGAAGTITLAETPEAITVGGYFDRGNDPESIAREIEGEFARRGMGSELLSIELTEVADQDWMQKWKEGFEPIIVGERLIVAPSWRLPADAAGREVIRIDPGMAFGTGTHETTRLCLEAIERCWTGGRMLDVGTGTGILAIAAAKLGPAVEITGIDVDPVAVAVARENVEINGVSRVVSLREGQPRSFANGGYDLVVANLTAEVIIGLIADLVGCIAAGGTMILSGILTVLAADVEASLNAAGMVVIERQEAGEWTMLVARQGV